MKVYFSYNFVSRNSVFIHSVICLTTGPKPPPIRFLHTVRSRASSFKWEYPVLSLRSSSSLLRLLPLLLATSISPFIFPSITSFRRQFLRKMCLLLKSINDKQGKLLIELFFVRVTQVLRRQTLYIEYNFEHSRNHCCRRKKHSLLHILRVCL